MGRASKGKPVRLAEKLLQIRLTLGLSQNEMIRRLGASAEILQASISGYELGTRIPPLNIILQYAQVAGVCTDTLLNDDLDLPEKLPSKPKH
jgi:transcriptional regulator with XRE-family HTH domain